MTNKNNDFEKFVVKPKDIKVLERQSFKQKTPHLFDSKGNFVEPEKMANPVDDRLIINFRKDNPQFFTKGRFDPSKAIIIDPGYDMWGVPYQAQGMVGTIIVR